MKTTIYCSFVALLVSAVLISCGPTSENAKKYDDQLVSQLKKVFDKESLLIEAISKKTPEKLDALFSDLKLQVDSAEANVEKMEAFDGKNELRNTAINVFDAYKNVIASDYKALLVIAKIPDSLYIPDDDDRKIDLCQKIDSTINKANDEFKKLEKTFIEKYKIDIVEDAKAVEKVKK